MSNVKSWGKGLLALVILVGLSACAKKDEVKVVVPGGKAPSPSQTTSQVNKGWPASSYQGKTYSVGQYMGGESENSSLLDGLWMGPCEQTRSESNVEIQSAQQSLWFADDMLFQTVMYYQDLDCTVKADEYTQDSLYFSILGKDDVVKNSYQIDFQSPDRTYREIFHIQQAHDFDIYELRFGDRSGDDLFSLETSTVYTRAK